MVEVGDYITLHDLPNYFTQVGFNTWEAYKVVDVIHYDPLVGDVVALKKGSTEWRFLPSQYMIEETTNKLETKGER